MITALAALIHRSSSLCINPGCARASCSVCPSCWYILVCITGPDLIVMQCGASKSTHVGRSRLSGCKQGKALLSPRVGYLRTGWGGKCLPVKWVGEKRCCFGAGEGVMINPPGKGGASMFLHTHSPTLCSPDGPGSQHSSKDMAGLVLNSYKPSDNLI